MCSEMGKSFLSKCEDLGSDPQKPHKGRLVSMQLKSHTPLVRWEARRENPPRFRGQLAQHLNKIPIQTR